MKFFEICAESCAEVRLPDILPYLQGFREEKGLSCSYNLYFRMTSRRQRTDRQRRARKDARMNKYRQNAKDKPARDPEDDDEEGARKRCSRRKCIPIIILIVAIIAGGITVSFVVFTGKANADATVSTDSETCSDEWSEWTVVNACADLGPGPFEEQVRRTRYDSAACAGDGQSVEEETMYRDCGEEKDMWVTIAGRRYEWRGTNVDWGFGKFNR